jgi:hypothetical protein
MAIPLTGEWPVGFGDFVGGALRFDELEFRRL